MAGLETGNEEGTIMQIAPNNKALGSLQYVDNGKFVLTCQAAIKKHRGHRVRAAEELDVSVRTLMRWLAKYPSILKGLSGLQYVPTAKERAEWEERRVKRARSRARARSKSARA